MKRMLRMAAMLCLIAGPAFASGYGAPTGEDPFDDGWHYIVPKAPIELSGSHVIGIASSPAMSDSGAFRARLSRIAHVLAARWIRHASVRR
jgi:hypothetical protein